MKRSHHKGIYLPIPLHIRPCQSPKNLFVYVGRFAPNATQMLIVEWKYRTHRVAEQQRPSFCIQPSISLGRGDDDACRKKGGDLQAQRNPTQHCILTCLFHAEFKLIHTGFSNSLPSRHWPDWSLINYSMVAVAHAFNHMISRWRAAGART